MVSGRYWDKKLSPKKNREHEKSQIPIKIIFFILTIFTLLNAEFGPNEIELKREWTVYAQEGKDVEFFANIALNNTNQQIISIESSPQINLVYEGDQINGILNFTPKENITKITARIKAKIEYNPKILQDAQFVEKEGLAKTTDLIEPNEEIKTSAKNNIDFNSWLITLLKQVNFVNNEIEYDTKFWGKNVEAKNVIQIKRGVCVEYTHLAISMLNSIGVETRYVAGFANGGVFQPHAWAEAKMPSGEWIAIDPTFGEIGKLDNSHFAIAYSQDQSGIYDYVVSKADGVKLETKYEIKDEELNQEQPFPKELVAKIEFNEKTGDIATKITNSQKEIFFGKYQFSSYRKTNEKAILIRSGETIYLKEKIDVESLKEGFEYKIPIKIKLNDFSITKEVQINKIEKKEL
jgi:hypothetical protein